jgi:hypothetical protein
MTEGLRSPTVRWVSYWLAWAVLMLVGRLYASLARNYWAGCHCGAPQLRPDGTRDAAAPSTAVPAPPPHPALYLYSDADVVTDPVALTRLIDARIAAGHVIRVKRWARAEGVPHVGGLVARPREYADTVGAWIADNLPASTPASGGGGGAPHEPARL